MTDISDDISDGVSYLLDELGRAVTLRKVVSSGYDPSTGEASSVTVDHLLTGVITGYRDFEIDGSRILAGDRKCILVSDVLPETQDRIVAGADVYTVVEVKTHDINGTSVAYLLQLRR